MKKLILLLFIPLVFGCDIVKKLEDKKNDLDQLKLNGKVKSLKTTSYSAVEKFGEPVKDEFESQIEYIFNKDGFIKETDVFNENDELIEKWKRKYDDDGNNIESNRYNKDGELEEKWKYKYDDDGNIIESNRYNKDGELKDKWKYKYDDDGNMIEGNWYYEDGELVKKWTNKFDDDGNIIEADDYDKDGELIYEWKYKYDDNGNEIEANRYNEGQLVGWVKYKYENFDNNKNWLKKIAYEEERIAEITEREIEYYD